MAFIDIGGGGGGGQGGGGLIPFAPSLLVATVPIDPVGLRSCDGRSTGNLERVLLTAQANPIQNGIWLTDGAGAWTRPSDLPVGANAAFAFTFIQEGDIYANTGWANGSVPTSVVGVDPQQWVQVIAPGQLVANNGLLLTGSTLDVHPSDGSLVATPGNIAVGVISDAQHGDRGGGTLHAAATPSVAGFLSAVDKTKLDALPSGGGVPLTREVIAGDGLTGGGDLSADVTLAVGAPPDGSLVVTPDYVIIGMLATDVQHGSRGGGTLHTVATVGTPGFMSETDKVKLNSVATGATNTPLSGSLPSTILPDASGDVGTAPTAARADHVHGIVAATPVNVTKAPNAEGISSAFARADHKHDATTAAPVTVGTANTEGVSTSLARADHTHDHGAQTSPTLHAAATPGVAGFMSGADKQKLDTVATGAGTGLIIWGANAVSGTTTTRYLYPFYGAQLAPTSAIQYRMARGGTFRNMRVRHNVASGNAELIKYTLRVNGIATAMTVSLAANATDASNIINTVAVVAGDLVDLEVTKVNSIATSPTDILVSMELAG